MTTMHYGYVAVGEGKFALEAVVVVTPRGIIVTAGSPEFAHLGATAQAIPRPELGRTATVSILSVPCHRDEIPAHDIAAALATRFKMPCAASCGFHVENATKDDLTQVLNTTKELIDACESFVARTLRSAWGIDEAVVAVTPSGSVEGPVSREAAHKGAGILHQAFMTFLTEGPSGSVKLLLCRRSPAKKLWGSSLSDACSGHPRPGEELVAAAQRRLVEECGLSAQDVPLKMIGHIVYHEDHGDGHCEHEWCAVMCGHVPAGVELHINEQEIAEVLRVSTAEIDKYLAGIPEKLAPWTAIALADPAIRKTLAI